MTFRPAHPDAIRLRGPQTQTAVDWAEVRRRLAQAHGRVYWRSLEELADTPEFREYLEQEFPDSVREGPGELGRRNFLKLMGASLALAGVGACTRQPTERIVPYARQPEGLVPGQPLYFATAMPFAGGAMGLLVESHMGRPTKIEGNEKHPYSLGATDAFAQASVLDLYDPDRSQVITHRGRISTWQLFLKDLVAAMTDQRARAGRGLRILTEPVPSPTLAEQLRRLLAAFPEARWHVYEPVHADAVRAGTRAAFGESLGVHHRFDRADVVVALDSDFLCTGPDGVRHARDFISRRKPEAGGMNRLYAVESMLTVTGAFADHRLPLRPSQIERFAEVLAHRIGVESAMGGEAPATASWPESWIHTVAQDLLRHRGTSIVLAGYRQPPRVHELAHRMNAALENIGRTVWYSRSSAEQPADCIASLTGLVHDMNSGKVELLVILGGNPAYDAPVDLHFAESLEKVPLRIRLGLYDDETSALCHWHVPQAHFLESWSDVRAADGTLTIVQPLIAPLYGGKSVHEFVAAMTEATESSEPGRVGPATAPAPQQPDGDTDIAYRIVRDHWRQKRALGQFDQWWNTALHDGLIPGTESPPHEVQLNARSQATSTNPVPSEAELEISFAPDPTIWDGRFANNAWLQELPKPLTKLTWDNAAHISPATAQRLGLRTQDVVELRFDGRSVRAPILVQPGHADDCVTVTLGYGRTRTGGVGNRLGFNAYRVRPTHAMWFGRGLEVHPADEHYSLAHAQHHFSMEGRDLVRSMTLADFREGEAPAEPGSPGGSPSHPHAVTHALSLYPQYPYEGHAWGMAIDQTACTGCNACVIACQAENNIPVVGKTEVARGRELHWLRIDTYYANDLDNPFVFHQPIPCMHCERAPCEVVCPVAATMHGHEGLNEMVYNRCVGTRYCANNCPYKVRRFNFFEYAQDTPSLRLVRNPDVTVRMRGVMEKCTYCVQRINAARIEAKKENRRVRDGEVMTACQQACPTQAIAFGDINDPNSIVARLKKSSRNYALLEELNTQPRTTYLAKVTNPTEALTGEAEEKD